MQFKDPLPERDRIALTAGVYLALNDPSGKGEWPGPQIENAPSCPLAQFVHDGVTWNISGGSGDAPPRWVRARGRDDLYFLATGPGPDDARAWSEARRDVLTLKGPPAYYLVGAAEGGLRFIFRVYDGAPNGKRFADDVAGVLAGKLSPVAVYDLEGDAISLLVPTESGKLAELLRPDAVDGRRSATLFRPDGAYFVKGDGDALVMRGSGLPCAARYGVFSRERMFVIDARDETLDLGCRFTAENSWITVFASRRPDRKGDRRDFAERLKGAQEDGGVLKAVSSGVDHGPSGRWTGRIWLDKSRTLQALWFTRRGDYVIEFRATFTSDEADAVIHAAPALLEGALPQADTAESTG